MGQEFKLINKSKKEQIIYAHLPASKARELTGNPVTSAITTWYLLQNIGDEISFATWEDASLYEEYTEVTDKVVTDLIKNGIIEDNGIEIFDEDDPEVYLRKLENIWMR
ncbi:hypothetical protein [Gottfriedia solisilvae]|uniref:Uncharacterized protein n=1 Tax=Gottfriedia solisilvae TaxID=1516104 RepID=A0A8J3EXI4_9BACI|nr:hypothetical protein [Gottfriedia solisilvae]GGI12889.1 hypothetical protein GCM10007380_15170 [Gottfriedia solisilvae]